MERQMAERKDAIIALRSSPSMCKDASCHPSSMAKTAKPLLVGHSLPFENKWQKELGIIEQANKNEIELNRRRIEKEGRINKYIYIYDKPKKRINVACKWCRPKPCFWRRLIFPKRMGHWVTKRSPWYDLLTTLPPNTDPYGHCLGDYSQSGPFDRSTAHRKRSSVETHPFSLPSCLKYAGRLIWFSNA